MTEYREFAVRKLQAGAEISGLDLRNEIPPAIAKELYGAWLEHGLLLFHNVDSSTKHLYLSNVFGRAELHPMPELRDREEPLFMRLGDTTRYVYVVDGELVAGRLPWHRDTAYTPNICKGGMLRMVKAVDIGGETRFADTAAAYDALSEDMKAKLQNLEFKATLRMGLIDQSGAGSFWKAVRYATQEEWPGSIREPEVGNRYPSVVHPAVITHPESGRKCLFLSPSYVDYFIGLSQEESDCLLDQLTTHMISPAFTYDHRWAENDAMVWDNRRFMHAAMGYHPSKERLALRTTLEGSLAAGRYFEEGVKGPE